MAFLRRTPKPRSLHIAIDTLPHYIHRFPHPRDQNATLYHLLDTKPPMLDLCIGWSPGRDINPAKFTENPRFVDTLHEVVARHAINDQIVQASAAAYASEAGFTTTSIRAGNRSSGAGPTAYQGGSGGAGKGGWVHVCDLRSPAVWGRTADPEDILGSVEIDSKGNFVGEYGNYQRSGTYRIVSSSGMLGLSPYLISKLVERLRFLEKKSL